jgi:PhnB protein
MQTKLKPYFHFIDTTRQAMEFYKSVFGGELRLSTFKEFNASENPSEDNKIMHAELTNDNGITFMAADTPNRMEYHPGTNISMSLIGDDEAELKGYYTALSTGGQVVQPLEKAPWGDSFGMCTDKFGITWFVNITAKKV